MSALGVLRLDGGPHARRASAAQLAALSRAALDRPLQHVAELVIAEPSDEALVLGAFQRAGELGGLVSLGGAAGAGGAAPMLRRGTGGAEARVGPGTLWMQLALARPDALVACDPSRLANRYVRPLLRALGKSGSLAHYFDRDWLSVAKRPVGMIAFAHDTTSGRALVEAIVAIDAPFAVRPRGSYLGKEPATLAELGAKVDLGRLGDAIVESYATAYACPVSDLDGAVLEAASAAPPATVPRGVVDPDERWAATRDEAIGVVAAGRDGAGRLRIGGELMVSRDAVARLEDRLVGIARDDLGAALDETLGAPGVALLGVRSLVSIRDAILEALDRDAT